MRLFLCSGTETIAHDGHKKTAHGEQECTVGGAEQRGLSCSGFDVMSTKKPHRAKLGDARYGEEKT